jgi:uncharacterized protein
MPLDPELVKILRCPKCKGELEEKETEFHCPVCRLRFLVENGIPNFLISEAKPIQD